MKLRLEGNIAAGVTARTGPTTTTTEAELLDWKLGVNCQGMLLESGCLLGVQTTSGMRGLLSFD